MGTCKENIGGESCKVDEQDKRGRRNNVVIKGAKLKDTHLREEVQSLMNEKQGINPEVIKIRRREEPKVVLAKISTWEGKKERQHNRNEVA